MGLLYWGIPALLFRCVAYIRLGASFDLRFWLEVVFRIASICCWSMPCRALGPKRHWAQTDAGPKRALAPNGPWAQVGRGQKGRIEKCVHVLSSVVGPEHPHIKRPWAHGLEQGPTFVLLHGPLGGSCLASPGNLLHGELVGIPFGAVGGAIVPNPCFGLLDKKCRR